MKTKSLVVTFFLFFATFFLAYAQENSAHPQQANSTQPQEKYVFAAVSLWQWTLTISTGDNFEEIKLGKDDIKMANVGFNISPLVKKINEMAKNGWEVFNTTDMGQGVGRTATCYLRKRI